MKRDEWEFPYGAEILNDAATKKNAHHFERQKWWENKKQEVMTTIKSEGIEIDESLAGEYVGKMSNYSRGTTVMVRNDLQKDLDECVAKIKEHRNKAEGYAAWTEVLSVQKGMVFNLHQEDWLYFFGK